MAELPDSLALVIDIYSKRVIKKALSEDVIKLIILYHGKSTLIVCIKPDWHPYKILSIVALDSNQCYNTHLHITSDNNPLAPDQYQAANFSTPYPILQKIISQKSSLPNYVKSAIKGCYENKSEYCSDSLLSSNNWGLMFKFGEETSNIVALHPQFCNYRTNTYQGYSVLFPNTYRGQQAGSMKAVYNSYDHVLYHFHEKQVYSLDLNMSPFKNWKKWKDNTGFEVTHSASCCMVDNNRFIAVIGANNIKSYILALNETKLAVPIADCCQIGWYRKSMYHDKLHKIITVGDKSLEWYDFNKDKSLVIKSCWEDDLLEGYPENIWYSSYNPRVLYCAAKMFNDDYYIGSEYIGGLWQIDLRENTKKIRSIVWEQDGDDSNFNSNFLERMHALNSARIRWVFLITFVLKRLTKMFFLRHEHGNSATSKTTIHPIGIDFKQACT